MLKTKKNVKLEREKMHKEAIAKAEKAKTNLDKKETQLKED